MNDFDVIVVGGGPIGLASAIEARLAGLSVALIEPRPGAIDKACGEGLMPGAVPLLARLGVDPVGMPLRGVSYNRGRHRADHLFATGVGRGVRRTVLHDSLSARVDELGVTRVAGRVEGVVQDGSGVSAAGIRGSYLFAADGLHSMVRRSVGLDRPVSRARRRFGLRRHFRVAPWTDLIEVHWAKHAEIYATPTAPDVVGIAILGPTHTDFDEVVASVPALAEHLRDAEPLTPLRGAGPFKQKARRPSAGRVLLVGDASGYVDAITGEGLRLGFDQARIAVEAVVADAPRSYDAAWARTTKDFRSLTSGLVFAATSPVRGGIVPLAAAAPNLFGYVVEKLAR